MSTTESEAKPNPVTPPVTTAPQQKPPINKPVTIKAMPVKKYPAPPEPPKARPKVSQTSVMIPPSEKVIQAKRYTPSTTIMQTKRPSTLESPRFFENLQTFFGLGDREFVFGVVPRGYGLTLLALSGCYSLLRWERNRIKKSKKKPPNTPTNEWYTKLKTIEKVYSLARNDFPRTVMLALIGGFGLPHAAAVGALFWCAGRAVDFHEAEEKPGLGVDTTEAVLCRFGKFLMICGICKFAFDLTRGKINCILNE